MDIVFTHTHTACTHTHTACIHTHTQTHTLKLTHSLSHTLSHSLSLTLSLSHSLSLSLSLTHCLSLSHKHTLSLSHVSLQFGPPTYLCNCHKSIFWCGEHQAEWHRCSHHGTTLHSCHRLCTAPKNQHENMQEVDTQVYKVEPGLNTSSPPCPPFFIHSFTPLSCSFLSWWCYCFHSVCNSALCLIHVTEEVCAKIQQAFGPTWPGRPPDIVKRCKLEWYGHVSRSSGLAKTILQGTVKGGRRKGRKKKRWEDNIREWTGLEFTRSKRAVQNREKWR